MTSDIPRRGPRLGDLTTTRSPMAILPEIGVRLTDPAATAEIEAAATAAAARTNGRIAGGVSVIRITGVISPRGSWYSSGGGLVGLQQAITEAMNASDIGGIVLDIDSPGGHIDLLAETSTLIREARTRMPVIAVANTMAASAAYWLAAQADEILVSPSGQVGSVGVYIAHQEYAAWEERIGITTTLLKAGKYKTDGNEYEPLSDTGREDLQSKTDQCYEAFLADVALGRGVSAATVRADYGEGRMFYAADAISRGMADRIGTVEDAIQRAASGDAIQRASAAAPAAPTPSPSAPREGGEPLSAEQLRQRAAVLLASPLPSMETT